MNRLLTVALLVLVALAGPDRVGAQAPFTVTRVELVFPNGRGEITVPLRYPDLRAFGLLRFSGIGVAQGTWKVDGRIIGPIAEPTAYGEDLIISSPSLPTFEAGQHRVTLDLTNPHPTFRIPEVTYFVTNEDLETFRKRMEAPK
ncbi:MAG TPA: hypothetical protein VGT02_12065 [Methylomirabilota bacterium]|jgi:hypothetical protein|nr:hypothetical protein [Methylomirabilota bacterium]